MSLWPSLLIVMNLILLGLPGLALAQDEDENDQPLAITTEHIQTLKARFKKTEKDMVLIHWTSLETWQRWMNAGEISQAEFDTMIKNSSGMASGGGLYLASDTLSSKKFGDYALRTLIPKGTLLYDAKVAQEVFGLEEEPTDSQKAQIGQVVEFIHQTRNTESYSWWVTHSYSLVRKRGAIVPFESAYDRQIPFGGAGKTSFESAYRELKRRGASADYARRLLLILFAQNTRGFYEALYQSPSNLDKVLSSDNAKRVDAVLERWIFGAKKFEKSVAVKGVEKDQWIQKQMQLLPQLFGDVTGGNAAQMLRVKPLNGPTMTVDPFELEFLKSNPLLAVAVQSSDGWKSRIQYQHPDPSGVPALLQKLLSETYDLLNDQFEDTSSEDYDTRGYRLLARWMSVAPFSRANDLIVRTYFSILCHLSSTAHQAFYPNDGSKDNAMNVFMFLSSADTLVRQLSSTDFYGDRGNAGLSKANIRIVHGIVAETVMAAKLGRKQSFQSLPEQSLVLEPLAPLQPFSSPAKQVPPVQPKEYGPGLRQYDWVEVETAVRKKPLWLKSIPMVPEIHRMWTQMGRTDLLAFLKDAVLDEATGARLTDMDVLKLSQLNMAPLTREEWTFALLDALPRISADDESNGVTFGMMLEAVTPQFDTTFFQLAQTYFRERFLREGLRLAKLGQFETLDQRILQSQIYLFALIESQLVNRSEYTDFLLELVPQFEKAEAKYRSALFFFNLEAALASTSQNEAEFLAMLKVYRQIIKLFPTAESRKGIDTTDITRELVNGGTRLLLEKKISLAAFLSGLNMIMFEETPHWIHPPGSVVKSVEQVEGAHPGALQSHVQWLLNNLASLEPNEAKRAKLKSRLEALVKPLAPAPSPGASVNRSLTRPSGAVRSAAPGFCSHLAGAASNKPKP